MAASGNKYLITLGMHDVRMARTLAAVDDADAKGTLINKTIIRDIYIKFAAAHRAHFPALA